MTRLVRAASAAALLALILLVPTGAGAQSVDAAAGDLQDNDVTFEDGALTDDDLEDLDRVVAQLQSDGGYFKVVVLASPTDEFSSTRAYAEEVRDALGGNGRVMVLDPQDVGIASNVGGETASINDAEVAAIEAANRSNSFATGVLAAADELGVEGSGGSDGGGSGSGGDDGPTGAAGSSSGSILPLILLLVFVGLVGFGFYIWWSSRKKKASQPLSPVSQAEGEQKVRSEVELTSNLVLELADKVEMPDASKEGVDRFPRWCLGLRRPPGRSGRGGHPRGARSGLPPPGAGPLEAAVLGRAARRPAGAPGTGSGTALPASSAPTARGRCSRAGTGAPLPAAPREEPVAHQRRHRGHHGAGLPRARQCHGPRQPAAAERR